MSTFVKSDAPLCLHQEWTSRNPIQIRAKSPLKQMLKEMEQVQMRIIPRSKGRPQSAHNLRSTTHHHESYTTERVNTPSVSLVESQSEYEADDLLDLMSDASSDSDSEMTGKVAMRTQQKVRAANAAFSNRAREKMAASKVHFSEGAQELKPATEAGFSDSHSKIGKSENGLWASRSSVESIGDRVSRNIVNHNVIGAGILGFSHPASGLPDEVS
jgi:hypothetical protein